MHERPDDAVETPLAGGNASGVVVRVGDTVRKPWLSATPLVTAYVEALLARGVDMPRPLGRDERGRQVIEFVPGVLAMDAGALDPAGLRRAGALVRAIHDASAAIPPAEVPLADPRWEPLLPSPTPPELVCHNDLAPWNLMLGEDRWVFIDPDGAAPSTRIWDLAYAAQAFAELWEGADVEVAGRRLRAFVVDGYRADAELRAALPDVLPERSGAMYELLRRSRATGREPWATMHDEGHGAHWRGARDIAARHREVWRRALA